MKFEVSEDVRRQYLQQAATAEESKPFITVSDSSWKLKLYTPSQICAARVLTYFTKEPETIEWINGMPDDAILFDVGANIGLYSVWAAATRHLRVLAFEPEAGNFQVLNENLRVNKLTERCLPFCLGISDKLGFGSMQIRDETVGTSGHQVQVTDGLRFRIPQPEAYQGIATATLDHLVYEAGLDCPTHIKIDVDGLEHAVVKGASQLLYDPRLRSVMVELMVKQSFHQDVIDTLVAAGFEIDEAMERAVYEKTEGAAHTGNVLFNRR